MTITIEANAIAGTGTAGGVDYDTFVSGFIAGLSGFPTFNSGAAFSGDEIEMIFESPATVSTKVMIANGPSIAYNFATHTVFGTINQLSLGVMGDGSSVDSNGHLVGTDAQLVFSGLDIANDASTRGDLHITVRAFMGGAAADIDYFKGLLAAEDQHFIGSAGADRYTGTVFDDTIEGGDGDDRLYGGKGGDAIDGGAGNDRLYGGPGADTLSGGAGNDRLYGGPGADTLSGGTGNDTYSAEGGLDTVIEEADAGSDRVIANADYTLGDNIERLELVGSGDISGTGNGLANTLKGNADANALDGAAGDDVLRGFDGDDELVGAAGTDWMNGDAGNDRFVYLDAADSQGVGRDRITGFATGQDVIDLTLVDAYLGTDGNQAFTFIGATLFSGTAGELRYNGNVLLGDVDGDGVGDFRIQLLGGVAVAAGDLLL